MSLREWWRNKSGGAKTITVLCTLLILEIGLCFSTPSIVNSYEAIFHIKPMDDEFGDGFGFMIILAMLCVLTLIALLVAPLYFLSRPGVQKLFNDSDKDQH